MVEFMENKKSGDVAVTDIDDQEISEEDKLTKVYNLFLGSSMSSGKNFDLETSLILTYYELEDWHMYRGLVLLVAFMVGLKVLTYYVLLAKLKSTK